MARWRSAPPVAGPGAARAGHLDARTGRGVLRGGGAAARVGDWRVRRRRDGGGPAWCSSSSPSWRSARWWASAAAVVTIGVVRVGPVAARAPPPVRWRARWCGRELDQRLLARRSLGRAEGLHTRSASGRTPMFTHCPEGRGYRRGTTAAADTLRCGTHARETRVRPGASLELDAEVERASGLEHERLELDGANDLPDDHGRHRILAALPHRIAGRAGCTI